MQVQREGYLDKPRIRDAFSDIISLRNKVSSLPGVKAASARAIGFSLVSSEDRTYGAQIVGVEAANEPEVSTIPGLIRQGRFFNSPDAYEVVIGKTLAQNLKLKIGDEITFLGQGRDGSLAASVLPVVGFFDSGSRDLDRSTVMMPLSTFQETFSMRDGGHSIVVVGSSLAELPQLVKNVESILPKNDAEKLVALRWDELLPGLQQAIELDMSSAWLFWISLIMIVGFSILNTFLMSVLERTREFGVLLSLGQPPKQIFGMVMTECLVFHLQFFLCLLDGQQEQQILLQYK